MSILVAELYLFPVKSCAPIRVNRLNCSETGPLFDREWMLVDENRKFMTQREFPELALIQPELDLAAGELRLRSPALSSSTACSLSFKQEPSCEVEVWGDVVKACDMGNECARWLEDVLSRKVRLVRISSEKRKKLLPQERTIRFADSYPLHLCSRSSLADLNARLPAPVEITRFRPNIVIEGCPAWAEDGWSSVRIGGHEFPFGKPCERCTITNTDPSSGRRGNDPLKTLAAFRRNARNKVEFGHYLLSGKNVEIAVGMPVEAKY